MVVKMCNFRLQATLNCTQVHFSGGFEICSDLHHFLNSPLGGENQEQMLGGVKNYRYCHKYRFTEAHMAVLYGHSFDTREPKTKVTKHI